MSFLRTSTARRLFFVLWCLSWLVIATLLLRPLPFSLPAGSDVVGHFLLFGAMSLAIVSFAKHGFDILIFAAITVVLGGVLEYGQTFVSSRYFDGLDLLANLVGGVIGGSTAFWIFRSWFTRAVDDVQP